MKRTALRILEPCQEDWQAMDGDARTRACARCETPVTNLSELSDAEAEAVLASRSPEHPVCLRATLDADDNVITRTTQESRFLDVLRALAAREKKTT